MHPLEGSGLPRLHTESTRLFWTYVLALERCLSSMLVCVTCAVCEVGSNQMSKTHTEESHICFLHSKDSRGFRNVTVNSSLYGIVVIVAKRFVIVAENLNTRRSPCLDHRAKTSDGNIQRVNAKHRLTHISSDTSLYFKTKCLCFLLETNIATK